MPDIRDLVDGNVLIVICYQCDRWDWFGAWGALEEAGWCDAMQHVGCPDHGTQYAHGFLVGSISDEAAARNWVEAHIATERLATDALLQMPGFGAMEVPHA